MKVKQTKHKDDILLEHLNIFKRLLDELDTIVWEGYASFEAMNNEILTT